MNELLSHYIKLNSISFSHLAILSAVLLLSWFLWRFVTGAKSTGHFLALPRIGRQGIKDFVFAGILMLVGLYLLVLVLAQLNAFNQTRLNDELLVRVDMLLTNTVPALTLASFAYPDWFVKIAHFAFVYFAAVFFLFFIFIFPLNRRLFLEAAGAFSLAFTLALFLWFLFPALSPQDRFIDNVYKLPIPPKIEVYLHTYAPQKEIVEFLESMRKAKEGLGAFPTNTFPSSHAIGGVGLVYYAWRFRRLFGYLLTPFALLSSFGAVLFAQHYAIDLFAGILVAVISICLVKSFVRKKITLG